MTIVIIINTIQNIAVWEPFVVDCAHGGVGRETQGSERSLEVKNKQQQST